MPCLYHVNSVSRENCYACNGKYIDQNGYKCYLCMSPNYQSFGECVDCHKNRITQTSYNLNNNGGQRNNRYRSIHEDYDSCFCSIL